MATQTGEMQIQQVKEEFKTKARKEIETSWLLEARKTLARELNPQERGKVINDVNKLFLGREEWLKQMREAHNRVLLAKVPPEKYSVDDEKNLNTEVNKLLATDPDFITAYKYQADTASAEALPSSAKGIEGFMQGLLPKIKGALGDGPLAFIGKLLEYIFNLITPIIPMITGIAEKINPTKTLNESNPKDALKKQEVELLTKMDSVLTEMSGYVDIQNLLKHYRDHLSTHADETFLKSADTQYLSDNLEYRKKMYEAFSSKANEILSIHASKVEIDKRIEAETREANDLKSKADAIIDPKLAPQKSILTNRLMGLQAVLTQQQTKKKELEDKEEELLKNFPDKDIGTKLTQLEKNHEPRFKEEKKRQKKMKV